MKAHTRLPWERRGELAQSEIALSPTASIRLHPHPSSTTDSSFPSLNVFLCHHPCGFGGRQRFPLSACPGESSRLVSSVARCTILKRRCTINAGPNEPQRPVRPLGHEEFVPPMSCETQYVIPQPYRLAPMLNAPTTPILHQEQQGANPFHVLACRFSRFVRLMQLR